MVGQTNTGVPQQPHLVLRIGISGARCIRKGQRSRIAQELSEVLKLLQHMLSELKGQDQVKNYYAPDSAQAVPMLRLISPLAKGADRLAAETAYELCIPVDVPMPFRQEVYEEDFTGKEEKCPDEVELSAEEDLQEFRRLLARGAGKVMLDGARNDPKWPGGDLFAGQSYEALGHYVVRHSDLLLAVWDGKAGGGRGGTQEIVEYAARAGVPIWWIHATAAEPPRWIADRLDLRQKPLRGVPAEQALRRHLLRLIPAPPPPSMDHRTRLVKIARWLQGPQPGPALEYFQQKRLPNRWYWNLHRRMITAVAWKPRRKPEEKPPHVAPPMPSSDAPAFWYRLYEEADARAGDYTRRYRSSYVIIIALAALSLIVGSFASSCEPWVKAHWPGLAEHHLLGVLLLPEVLLLVAAVWMLLLSIRRDWHSKSIEYRLLAELFRKQKTLATLGWALPIAGVEHLADSEALSWVAWLLAAVQRSSPFPHWEVDNTGLTVLRVQELRELLKEQIDYHHGTNLLSNEAAEGLEWLGGLMFVLLAVVTVVKVPLLSFEGPHWRHVLFRVGELLAGVLPTLSAAFLAVRSYAELQLVAEQSRAMVADLTRARERLEKLDEARPLASQVLGEEAAAVATRMLEELDGWGRTFRGKLLDLP